MSYRAAKLANVVMRQHSPRPKVSTGMLTCLGKNQVRTAEQIKNKLFFMQQAAEQYQLKNYQTKTGSGNPKK